MGTFRGPDGNLKVNIMPAVIRACKNETGCALPEVIAYYVQFLVKLLDRRDAASYPGSRKAFFAVFPRKNLIAYDSLGRRLDVTYSSR